MLKSVHEGKSQHKIKHNFVCQICTLAFTTNSNLNRHVSVMHGNGKKYPCTRCGKSFGTKANMNVHIDVVHDGKKPFKCDYCEEEFGRSYRKVHISFKHMNLIRKL